MIETNCLGISNALDYCGQQSQLEEADGEFMGQFVGIPVENFDRIIKLLNDLKERAIDFTMPSYAETISECLKNLKLE
jgi:hypothetical protein